jgi:ketosteroid isomerase-like protein
VHRGFVVAKTPEDAAKKLAAYFEAGDHDGMVSMYEPEGVVLLEGRNPFRGKEGIRQATGGAIGTASITVDEIFCLEAGDLALVYTKWSLTNGASGVATQVLRRQPSGDWLYVVDVPSGPATAGL